MKTYNPKTNKMNYLKLIPRILGVPALAIFVFAGTACQNGASGTGDWAHESGIRDYPFDADGNYLEDVALGQRRSPTSAPTAPPPPPQEPPPYEAVASTPSTPQPPPTTTPTPPPPIQPPSPPPAEPTPQPTPQPASTVSHTVKSGDTLWGLSRQYNTSVQAIKDANSLTSDVIRIGQTLRIPQ